MRIQLDVSKENAKELQGLMIRAAFRTHSELFNNCVTFVEWAVRQVEQGSTIVAMDADRERVREISMPFLKHVSDSRPAPPSPARRTERQTPEREVAPKSKGAGAGAGTD